MKRILIALVALLPINSPVQSQEVSIYKIFRDAAEEYSITYCDALMFGASDREAIKAGYTDFYLRLIGLVGKEVAPMVIDNIGRDNALGALVKSSAERCPDLFYRDDPSEK